MHNAQSSERIFEAEGGSARRPSLRETAGEEQSLIVLDGEGTIRHVSDEARELLDLRPHALNGEPFSECVHPNRRSRVRRDLTGMTAREKQRATWLLRLKTGLGPWQWFKVEAENRLGGDDPSGIVLRLLERGGGPGRD
ncbi:MAG: PAS domain-containing protein [Salinivenus sp.]